MKKSLLLAISILIASVVFYRVARNPTKESTRVYKENSASIPKSTESLHEASYYKKVVEDTVQCKLCPRMCTLGNGQRGLCGVRINRNGKLYTLVYGNPCTYRVDPIEKKPISHMLPGSDSFSIATAGCNLRCIFCQNWEIAHARPEETENYDLPPEKVVKKAIETG